MPRHKRAETIAISGAWRNPQFQTMEGLEYAIENMEDAEFAPVQVRGQTVPRYALMGKRTGQFFGTCTDKYRIVQNREAFAGLLQVLKDSNIPVSGSVISPNAGEYRLIVVIENPIPAQDAVYKYVIEAVNSYNGAVSWGGLLYPIRQICSNGMLGAGGVCDAMQHRHVMIEEKRLEIWAQFFNQATALVGGLYALIEKAQAQPVHNLEALYLGAGFGPNITKWAIEDFDKLVPESKVHPLTMMDAYNALTNMASNRTKGNYQTNREMMIKAGRMLETPCIELESKGLPLIKVIATP